MGINVRSQKLTDSTTEALESLSKKRTVILTDRKQTALDTDGVNAKLTSTIIEYVKETNKGNNFVCTIDVEDKHTVFKLTLESGVHLTKTISQNLFGFKSSAIITVIDNNLKYLKDLRSKITLKDNDLFGSKNFPFKLDGEDEKIMPLVMLNIKTKTKYF